MTIWFDIACLSHIMTKKYIYVETDKWQSRERERIGNIKSGNEMFV